MIVEDEVFIAFLLGEVLKGMGHEVCASERTQRGAIAAAPVCKPDLMIVDERLEEGSGLAVVEAVLRNGPTPHIFVSGDTSRIRRLMPDAVVLEKPYQEADLARAIQRALALGREAADRDSVRPDIAAVASRPVIDPVVFPGPASR
jgi:CheY-like chemotaxis protein